MDLASIILEGFEVLEHTQYRIVRFGVYSEVTNISIKKRPAHI